MAQKNCNPQIRIEQLYFLYFKIVVNWTCFIFHWKYYDWWKRSFDQETWGFTMFHCPACNRLTLWMSTEHEGYTQQWPMRLSMSPAVSRMSQLLMKSDKLVSIHLNDHALNFFTFAFQTKWSSQTHKRSGFWIHSYLIIINCLYFLLLSGWPKNNGTSRSLRPRHLQVWHLEAPGTGGTGDPVLVLFDENTNIEVIRISTNLNYNKKYFILW